MMRTMMEGCRLRQKQPPSQSSSPLSLSSSSSSWSSSCFVPVDVIIPGPFVVLQGNHGDGLCNTIQTLPNVVVESTITVSRNQRQRQERLGRATTSPPLTKATTIEPALTTLLEHDDNNNNDDDDDDDDGGYHHVESSSSSSSLPSSSEQQHRTSPTDHALPPLPPPPLGQLASTAITAAASRLAKEAAAALADTTNDSSRSSLSRHDDFVVVGGHAGSSSSSSQQKDERRETHNKNVNNNNNNHDDDTAAIAEWQTQCRRAEIQHRKEWKESLQRQVPSHLLDHCMMGPALTQKDHGKDDDDIDDGINTTAMWWQSHGKVAVLRDLPTRRNGKNGTADPDVNVDVIGTLSPGSTVLATNIVYLNSTTLEPIPIQGGSSTTTTATSAAAAMMGSFHQVYPHGQKEWIQMIYVEVVPSSTKGCGGKEKEDEGKDNTAIAGYACLSLDGYPLLAPGLPSMYVNPNLWIWRVTCPSGAFVRQGLDLTTRHLETLPYGSLVCVTKRCINNQGLSRLRTQGLVTEDTAPHDESATTMSTLGNANYKHVDGWCSELLNPLSGQRGVVAQPLPFPVPALYRVTLSVGAVIREDVELSSPQIDMAPQGTILKVVGRAFSEHPVDKSIERLQLAGNSGWISVRLNRPPPHDELVVEFVDIDGSFDPENPGRYHLQTQRAVLEAARERRAAATPASSSCNRSRGGTSNDDLSSINEDDMSDIRDIDQDLGDSNVIASSSYQHCSSVSQSGRHVTKVPELPKCVVCLTSDRNSCLVHGETGHIVCCLVCARILKARGDKCPVCRLPIDMVIQHFFV